MIAMYERLDEFAKTLPEPRLDDDWDAYYGQHVRNAERMRAEAFKYAVFDLGRGLRAAGRKLIAVLSAIGGRAEAGLGQADRPADAWRGGGD
jgi:hypothetical protein